MRKPLFYNCQASHFSIRNQLNKSCFFKAVSWVSLFSFVLFFLLFFSKMVDLGTPFKIRWGQNPLRVRGRTQQSVSGWFSPVAVSLSCTAPYLTSPFLYVISLGKCICRSPCDSRRAKRGVWELRILKMGPKWVQNYLQNCSFFQ